LVFICATLVSIPATAVEPIAGPWMVRTQGGIRIGIELPSVVDAFDYELVVLVDPADATRRWVPTVSKIKRPHRSASMIASYQIPADTTGELSLQLGAGLERRVRLAAPPPSDQPGTVAIAAVTAYPTRSQLDGLTAALGAAPELVVLFGKRPERVLGREGWEASIPVVLIDGAEARSELLQAMAGPGGDWKQGLHWGRLGLPVASVQDENQRPLQAGTAIASDLSPWQVLLDPHSSWRLDRPRAERGDTINQLVRMCRRRGTPLMVGAGPSWGFVSDPLMLDAADGSLLAASGGTRYVSLSGGARDIRDLPGQVAQLHVEPVVLGLRAAKELTVALVAGAGELRWQLRYEAWPEAAHPPLPIAAPARLGRALREWQRSASDDDLKNQARTMVTMRDMSHWAEAGRPIRAISDLLREDTALAIELDDLLTAAYPWPRYGLASGAAWGVGASETVLAQWLAAEDADARAAAAHHAAWLPLPDLEHAERLMPVLEPALARYQQEGSGVTVLRRLVVTDLITTTAWLQRGVVLPDEIAREILLRRLGGAVDLGDPVLREVLARSTDAIVVGALIAEIEQDPTSSLLPCLVERSRRIAAGRVPMDRDPIVQHRLVTAIFASPYLSPTPLRPIAVGMRDKLDPRSRGPVTRFLERHGEDRPLNR
jgi:hypothetical protein